MAGIRMASSQLDRFAVLASQHLGQQSALRQRLD
jgi:hypothetical protein